MKMRSESGFSIIELAIVGLLFAAVAGLAIPQIQQSMEYYRLNASANLVAAELNAARALAISRSWVYEADLDAVNSTIQIIDPGNSSNNPRTQKTLESGVTFSAVPGNPIRFYSRGHARSGTITLLNQNGDTISIQVNAAGKIEIL